MLVVHWGQSQARRVRGRSSDDARRAVADHAIIRGAIRLRPRRVRNRHGGGEEGRRRCSRGSRDGDGKFVSALAIASTIGGQVVIDQAAVSRSGNAGSCSAAQLGQRGIALCGISAVIADFPLADLVVDSKVS